LTSKDLHNESKNVEILSNTSAALSPVYISIHRATSVNALLIQKRAPLMRSPTIAKPIVEGAKTMPISLRLLDLFRVLQVSKVLDEATTQAEGSATTQVHFIRVVVDVPVL
jgi:hypothetical protein